MAKKSGDGPRPSDLDIMAAAVATQCDQWVAKTGRSRESFCAAVDEISEIAGVGARMALDHHERRTGR